MPHPPSADDRLFGALVLVFGVLGIGLALLALRLEPPALLTELRIPERVARLVLRPSPPPSPPEQLPVRSLPPVSHPSGRPRPAEGERPTASTPEAVLQRWATAAQAEAETPDNIEAVAAALGESDRFEGGPVASAHRAGDRSSFEDARIAGPHRLGGGTAEIQEVALVSQASLLRSIAARALPPPPPPPRPLTPAAQSRLLRAHRHQVASCHRALLARSPGASGRVVARVVLEPDRAPAVDISEDTVKDAAFASCIRLRVARWSFPQSPVRSETDFVFVFSPG